MKLKYYLRGLGIGIVVTAIIMSIAASKNHKMTDEEIVARAKQLGMIEDTVLTVGTDGEDNAGQETDEQSDNNGTDVETQTDAGQSEPGTAKPQNPENVSEPDTTTNADTSEPDIQVNAGVTEPDTKPDANSTEPNTQANANESESDTKPNANETESDTQPGANVAEPDTQPNVGTSKTGTSESASEFPKVIIIKSGESSYTVSKKLAEIGAVESAADFDTYLCEHGYDKKIRAGTYTIPTDASDEQMAKIVTGVKITE